MAYLVALYCIVTAVSVVLFLLKLKWLLAFFTAMSAILAIAVGDDLRSLLKPGPIVRKLVRAIMAIFALVVALWMGQHVSINLYRYFAPGTLWCLLGTILAFAADSTIVERRRSTRL